MVFCSDGPRKPRQLTFSFQDIPSLHRQHSSTGWLCFLSLDIKLSLFWVKIHLLDNWHGGPNRLMPFLLTSLGCPAAGQSHWLADHNQAQSRGWVRSLKIFPVPFRRIPLCALVLTQDSLRTENWLSLAVPWPLILATSIPQMLTFLALRPALIPRSEMNKTLKSRARQFPTPDMKTLEDKHFLCCASEARCSMWRNAEPSHAGRRRESFLAFRVRDRCRVTQKVLLSIVLTLFAGLFWSHESFKC